MEKYNFKPDFKLWWENPNTSQEDLAWLVLGIDPSALKRVNQINSKTDETTNEERSFSGHFDSYLCNLPQYLFLGDNHRDLIKCDWNGIKEFFLNEVYIRHFNINPDFCNYLQSIGKMPNNPKLELYKNYKQYVTNLAEWNVENINDEDTALSLLLGFNPEFFSKFIGLYTRQKTEKRTPEGFAPYHNFLPEEKWLFAEYHNFLKEEFPRLAESISTPIFYIIPPYKTAKELSLWQGDFSSYVQSLHDNGFIFRPETYKALKSLEIELSYSPASWALQFYERHLKQGVLKLQDAASLYLGSDPHKGREFVCFANTAMGGSGAGFALESSETIAEFDSNGNFVPPPEQSLAQIMNEEDSEFDERHYSLERFVRNHIAAGNVTPARDDGKGKLFFKPKEIVIFFRDFLPLTFRSKALYIALGLEKQNPSKSFSAPANIEAHKKYYREYLNNNITMYINGELPKPWKDQNKDEITIKEKMGSKFSRKIYREARQAILAEYPNSSKTRFGIKDHEALKAFISEQKQAA